MELPQNQPTNRYCRVWGIFCIVLGLILAKWQIYDPLHAAEQNKQRVWILLYFVGLGIILPPMGLLLLIFGRGLAKWVPAIDPQNLNLKSLVLPMLFAVAVMVVFVYVLAALDSQGYHISRGW
jgi:hypothetical protein